MGFTGQVWQLRRGQELLGEIAIDEADFPWLSGRFTPKAGFAEVKALFDRELELLDDEPSDDWEAVYGEIQRTLTLVAPDGPVAEFLLHIEDGQAWFRWIDEPFDGS